MGCQSQPAVRRTRTRTLLVPPPSAPRLPLFLDKHTHTFPPPPTHISVPTPVSPPYIHSSVSSFSFYLPAFPSVPPLPRRTLGLNGSGRRVRMLDPGPEPAPAQRNAVYNDTRCGRILYEAHGICARREAAMGDCCKASG